MLGIEERVREKSFVNNQENSLFMLLKVWVLVDKSNNESKCLYFTGKCEFSFTKE